MNVASEAHPTLEELEREGWEVFTGYWHNHATRQEAKKPLITITKGGRLLTMNAEAYREIGSPSWVTLAYNRSTATIRICRAGLDMPHALPVRKHTTIWGIPFKSFVNYYALDVSKSQRYEAAMQDGCLFVDLRTPQERTTHATTKTH